jgi:SPP1 gp7 family putative phage head morphogenesis protein
MIERSDHRAALVAWVASARFLGRVRAFAVKASSSEKQLELRLRQLFFQAEAQVINNILKGGPGSPTLTAPMSGMSRLMADEIAGVTRDIVSYPTIGQTLKDQAFTASSTTMARLRGDVMDTISQAYNAGLGTNETAALVRQQFEAMASYEAKRIAQTEVNSAQNFGKFARMSDARVSFGQWITAQDERVRDTEDANHVILHGQIVRMGQPFSNGLKFPGDKDGPIAEWINCRCTIVPYILPEGMIAPPGDAPFYEADLVPLVQVTPEDLANEQARQTAANTFVSKVELSSAKGHGGWQLERATKMANEVATPINPAFSQTMAEAQKFVRFGGRVGSNALADFQPTTTLGTDYIRMGKYQNWGFSYTKARGTLAHETGHALDNLFDFTGGPTATSYPQGSGFKLAVNQLDSETSKGVAAIRAEVAKAFARQRQEIADYLGGDAQLAAFIAKHKNYKYGWWSKLDKDKSFDIVTRYSLKNEQEFFCEALKQYYLPHNGGQVVAQHHPKLDKLIRKVIFEGRDASTVP